MDKQLEQEWKDKVKRDSVMITTQRYNEGYILYLEGQVREWRQAAQTEAQEHDATIKRLENTLNILKSWEKHDCH